MAWREREVAMTDGEALIAAAAAVRRRAYAPYSHFPVGAAILADDGKIYLGVNVENASYPEGICAESAALAAMIAGGARRALALAVVSEAPQPVSPCGGCRQRLSEFAGPDLAVHLANPAGVRQSLTLGELLPHSFRLP
jgi:cytidine deaminase